ncbi:MAG: ferrous iron transport protein A [Clostridia bacterium]|nr:ferrous iron transport protein A [Clostridia bacterium]
MTENRKYLSDMQPGETAFIYNVDRYEMRNRLYDLGFVCGTRVECVAAAPLDGPCAYLVRGALIALRRGDAGYVKLKCGASAHGEG